MDPELLIEEIRKFPVLYDQSNEKYRNSDYKERVWKIVSANVRAEGHGLMVLVVRAKASLPTITTGSSVSVPGGAEECKKRWNSIRDQLRRTLQKRKTKSGQAAEKHRKYKYEDILGFLLPHLGEREGLTNVPPEGNENNDGSESIADSQDTHDAFTQETYQEENVSNVDGHDKEDEPGTTNGTNMRATSSPSPTTNKVPADKHKFATPSATKRKIPGLEVKTQDSPASQLMAYLLAEKIAEKTNAQSPQTSKQDPVDAFLCGIAPTLKSLNPILLNEAKGKIFGVVQEVERRQLQMNAIGQGRYWMPPYSMSPSQSSVSASPSTASPPLTTPYESTNVEEQSYVGRV